MGVQIPEPLLAVAARGPRWASWLKALPRLLDQFLTDWELRPDGPALHGFTALVLPVRTASDTEAVLKLAFPDEETEHEALALQHWGGRSAVRLIRANPRSRALLLDRLLPFDLADQWDVQACEIVGDLYRGLHLPAPPQLHRLSAYASTVDDRLAALPQGVPLPPRLIDQTRALIRSFLADPQTDGHLIHTDLHYGNVLACADGSWRAIDPKPLSGDPHYEVAPLLINRWEELQGRVRSGVRDRFFAAIDAAGLEEQRAKDWVVVRMLDLASQRILDPAPVVSPATPSTTGSATGSATSPEQGAISDHDWLTRCVAIAKAVQD